MSYFSYLQCLLLTLHVFRPRSEGMLHTLPLRSNTVLGVTYSSKALCSFFFKFLLLTSASLAMYFSFALIIFNPLWFPLAFILHNLYFYATKPCLSKNYLVNMSLLHNLIPNINTKSFLQHNICILQIIFCLCLCFCHHKKT